MSYLRLMSMSPVITERDRPYLPKPNKTDLLLTDLSPPEDLNKTAFVLPIMDDGSLVMANVRKIGRGLEIPGGHIDPGEDAEMAARREAYEETASILDRTLVPIAVLRMISDGTVPADYRYPHPLGFQRFFASRVIRLDPYVENEECLAPRVISPDEVEDVLKPAHLILWKQGIKALGIAPGGPRFG